MALTDENISALTNAIKSIIESSLIEPVLKRLDSFGCTPTADDAFLVGFSVQKVENSIKNDCNITEIPEGLVNAAVDMVCGVILLDKYRTGQLEMSSLNLDGALESVKIGNASVTFSNSASEDAKLNTLISILLDSGRSEFACYRKIKW